MLGRAAIETRVTLRATRGRFGPGRAYSVYTLPELDGRRRSSAATIHHGASFQGLAALLGMLNSCSSNVTVVNIDNGFGAGYVASLINRL